MLVIDAGSAARGTAACTVCELLNPDRAPATGCTLVFVRYGDGACVTESSAECCSWPNGTRPKLNSLSSRMLVRAPGAFAISFSLDSSVRRISVSTTSALKWYWHSSLASA